MNRIALTLVVLSLMAGTALAQTQWRAEFGLAKSGSVSSIAWSELTYGSKRANNTGGEGLAILTRPEMDWYFPAALYKVDLPPEMQNKLILSATFRVKDNWWNSQQDANGNITMDTGLSNVELRRIDSPVPWNPGNGTSGGRWGAASNGVGMYWADYNNVTQSGTTWSGAYMAGTDSWRVPENQFDQSVMKDLVSSATVYGSISEVYDDQWNVIRGGVQRGAEFDARPLVQKWIDGIWKNDGFALWAGNAESLYKETPDDLNNYKNGLMLLSSGWFGDNQCGLVITYRDRLPGDANNSGLVDQDDYKVWYDNYGTGTTWLQGNFKGTGVVDQDDYKTWYDNYGTSAFGTGGGSAPVPEPMTLLLLAAGLPLLRRKTAR